MVEVVVLALVVGFAAEEAPGLASEIARDLARLRHPSASGLTLAVSAEVVSLLAISQVPRWLLRRGGVRLGPVDAVALTLAANGMAIILPAGAVSSTVWTAHQYSRRGARAALATWTVLASGFASAVTLLAVAIVGALAAHVARPSLLLGGSVVFVGATAGIVALTHRAEGLRRPDHPPLERRWHRLTARLVTLVGDTAGQRAGWATGAAVLVACGVNWLADAACLAAAFWLLRLPVPWHALLLAYAAGQLAGALVPLPGGLGVVETGMVGVLVALGTPAGPALAVVAVYRAVGYWAPLLLSVPAYGWARRHVEPPGSHHDDRRPPLEEAA